MTSSDRSARIVVIGAAGVVGRRVCAELARRDLPIAIAGHRGVGLAALARTLPVAAVHFADVHDARALARAVTGAAVVVNAAGPLRATAAPVLAAALAAGAHYVDVGGAQADLAVAWAARRLLGVADPGAALRDELAPRLADDDPVDDISVSYAYDGLTISAGTQRALFGAIGTRVQVWRRDRWEDGRAGDHRRIDAGPQGARDAIAYAAGDPITIPRHVTAQLVAAYVSTTRRPGTTAALRVLARVLRVLPRTAADLLAPYAASDADYAQTELAVVARVRRGPNAAQIVVRGRDLYRTTAAITAWAAAQLAGRAAGPIGMRAPGELFRGEPALREIARAADLTIEPSF